MQWLALRCRRSIDIPHTRVAADWVPLLLSAQEVHAEAGHVQQRQITDLFDFKSNRSPALGWLLVWP